MRTPALPDDEPFRLQSLRELNVLDTDPEERFDKLSRMAKRMFGVPIALVSLVAENRQWFKSCVGLDATETPRDISFCGHAILGNDVFVIPDATNDQRFSDNPLVTGPPNIQFYAGCPIRHSNGSKLGTLCIIDSKPREFNAQDKELLIDLASMVEKELAAVQLAILDELTGLNNRRGFLTFAEKLMALCTKNQLDAHLVFMDLDKFKFINDTFGHAEGDRVLTAFADIITSVFRGSDILGRLGGDEFVALVAGMDGKPVDIATIKSRFADKVDAFNASLDKDYELLFSMGTVSFDPDIHNSIEALLDQGDNLMYQHKQGKDDFSG